MIHQVFVKNQGRPSHWDTEHECLVACGLHVCTDRTASVWMPCRIISKQENQPTDPKKRNKQFPSTSFTNYERRNYYYKGEMVAVIFRSNLMATLKQIPNPFEHDSLIRYGQPTATTRTGTNSDRERSHSRPRDKKRGSQKRKAKPSDKVDKKSRLRKRPR